MHDPFPHRVPGWCRVGGCLLLLALAAAPAGWAQPADALREHIEVDDAGPYHTLVARFYTRRAFAPAWLAGGRVTPPAVALAHAAREAEAEGFDLRGAHRAAVEAVLRGARPEAPLPPPTLAELELRLTDLFFHYGTFLLQGRVAPHTVHPGWSLPPRQADLVLVLEAVLRQADLGAAREVLAPADPAYERLRQALARYHRLAGAGGWAPLPPGRTLRQDDAGPDVQALRERLRRSGDLPADAGGTERFDAALDEAVRAFQARHGLDVDGAVGPATRAALDVPVEDRIRQIVVNLERLRWLPADLGRRRLVVNVPGYRLEVVEDGAPVLAMRVIVGTPRTPTPLFSTTLTEVVLAPYWNVPTSIARNEILPRERRDPGYLARNGMRVLSGGRIRQDPGPANPLGRVKFTIRNPFGIGLHDTPERHLFERSFCAFSHGCMRAEKPLELAAYLLRADSSWTRERMEATVARWREVRIPVPEPLPVHVLYHTAWVDEQDVLHLRADPYGHDARLEAALALAGR